MFVRVAASLYEVRRPNERPNHPWHDASEVLCGTKGESIRERRKENSRGANTGDSIPETQYGRLIAGDSIRETQCGRLNAGDPLREAQYGRLNTGGSIREAQYGGQYKRLNAGGSIREATGD